MPVMFNTILIQEGIDPVQVRLLRLRKRRKGLLFVVPTQKRKELRAHSKAKTPVARIVKITKRTEASLRQKAIKLGIKLGHRR